MKLTIYWTKEAMHKPSGFEGCRGAWLHTDKKQVI